MNSPGQSPVLRDFLGRVRSHLPLGAASDIVRELESSILDRVDAMAEAEHQAPDERLVERALAEMGAPEQVAGRYLGERYVVAPEHFRPFVLWTCLLFCLHLVLVGVATTLARPLHVGLFAVSPLGHRGLLSMLSSALHALLLDVGLMVLVFTAVPVVRRASKAFPQTFAVDVRRRSALAHAALVALMGVLVAFFRDDLFVVVSDGTHPLFTEEFSSALPLVLGAMGLSCATALLYAGFGERRVTVALDAVHGILGIALALHVLAGGPVLAIPAVPAIEPLREGLNAFLEQLGNLVLLCIACAFAVKTLRRLVRFSELLPRG